MKVDKMRKMIFLFFALTLVMTAFAFAQDKKEATKKEGDAKDPRKEFSEAERPEETYLARFKGIEISEKLMLENLEKIYMLKIIASNFKDQGWDKDYKDIYEGYKKGCDLYYRRDVVFSRVELEKNRKAIHNLFKKVADVFKKQDIDMLSQCADKILTLQLDEKSKADPNKSTKLFQNISRLRMAYQQLDEAERNYMDNYYVGAVYHLRTSKLSAISILEDLDPAAQGKYDVHKADNLNRLLNPESSEKSEKK